MTENNNSNQYNEKSLARKIWSDQLKYIYYAQGKFNLELEDAEELFSRAGYAIVKQPERIDPKENLTAYVRQRMKWLFLDDIDKKKRDDRALSQSEYNFTDKDDQFLEVKPVAMDKPFHLRENSIKTKINDKKIIYVSTRNPHKANIGSSVCITGLNGLSKTTNNRLRNKWGNEILINEIVDEHTFTIKVWFDHEIDENGIGGKEVRVKIKPNPSVLENESLSKVLSQNTEEDMIILKMRIEACKKQFTGREKAILDLSLHPDKDITNNQKPTTNNIAEILEMAAGTVGDIAIQVREAFINCIEGNTGVNV